MKFMGRIEFSVGQGVHTGGTCILGGELLGVTAGVRRKLRAQQGKRT